MSPAELKYAKSHEWVRIDGNVATIGITEYAVSKLTDLTYIELPEEGDDVAQGESFGEIESVKAVAELYSPVSGTVSEINASLQRSDGLNQLSSDPFGSGWIIKVKLSGTPDFSEFLGAADYDKFIADH
ncbi:MAG: glycine cleavage system protein GcvH [Planctomycetes bacterium]|nr:glycine cleavage system protein GcvH [Planctomycetota bacterium]